MNPSPFLSARFARNGPGLRSRAFTLVELLVVVAAVGALIAISSMVFSRVATAGNAAKCASNMRQIGAAIALFNNDNDGRFPRSAHDTSRLDRTWIFTLAPYLDNVDEVRVCPSDPHRRERLANNGTSYLLNEYVCVAGPEGILNARFLPRPSQTITMFVASDRKGTAQSEDHTHSRNWFKGSVGVDRVAGNWDAVTSDIEPDRHGGDPRDQTHAHGAANYLYADGHVTSIDGVTLKKWVTEGLNFAVPPGQQPAN